LDSSTSSSSITLAAATVASDHLRPALGADGARGCLRRFQRRALQQATLTLADELADRRITVNTVNPSATDTGWGLAEQDPGLTMPFGRWGQPDDVARLVTWLCSDDARWITGQTIDSEGGFRRWN
jgi:hypothetical protein